MADSELAYKPTDAVVEGTRVSEFFDPRFVGLLEQTFAGAKLTHFSFAIEFKSKEGKDREEVVTVGHRNKDEYDSKVLRLSTSRPETFVALVKALASRRESA